MFFLMIAGMAEMVNMAANHTALQLSAPQALRGRVAGLLPMFPALMAVGALSTGTCADWLGPKWAVVLLSLMGIAVALLAWFGSAAIKELRLSQLVQKPAH
jgi:MFS family permease